MLGGEKKRGGLKYRRSARSLKESLHIGMKKSMSRIVFFGDARASRLGRYIYPMKRSLESFHEPVIHCVRNGKADFRKGRRN
jgi:hypothetical protein